MNRKEKALEFIDAEYIVNVKGRHLEVTDAMKDYAIDKVSKIEKFLNRIIEVNVVLNNQKLIHTAEIILHAGQLRIKSHASSLDMYESINKAVAKLEAQILRYKSKIQDHHSRNYVVEDITVDVIPSSFDDEYDFNEEEVDNFQLNHRKSTHQVVEQDTLSLKTLTTEEAILKMDLSKDHFMLFKTENQKLKVIYRREDGNYGIIEPTC
ncbi:MAG: ribosome-associated translation inhibitor RaiA [Parachlamydiaceae bacterium]|nr:ribosome-associated translation inhibitor RaiA [Parachlamydiaceae bacterium]